MTWNDPHELVQIGFEHITEELDSIFRELGADIEWNEDSSRVLERRVGKIVVLLLPEKPGDWMPGKNVMGVVSHDTPPVVRIFYAGVTNTLGFEPAPLRPGDSEERAFYLARAIARVLAHEIIHAIAPPHPHASSGLMNPRLTRSHLTAEEVIVDSGSVKAFVAALNNNRKQAAEGAP